VPRRTDPGGVRDAPGSGDGPAAACRIFGDGEEQ